ncbi:MAG: CO dehydrogenase/CO-methylating acetyl-CoA synthase complex subunit beta [Sulfolobales archaeon]|nr:CO dehydrogenase/CO-methylating acetyl-CoA synthase complex subunit beta [Sulfolobales archaeon]MCX8199383.1 CO dehydrogenase/CO-methylating acetyl-CoA synthase complex subunit beta [Sulfolobales archaeon]MDW8170303.1 CO dehydrogenase/CO-methylating acetyl-CoA synthase complex subunit beta [Desulfurococcaceae archaeon]
MNVKLGILTPIEVPGDVSVREFTIPPTPEKSVFADIPVDVGPQYEGQRIRKDDMYVELGGPKNKHKFELLVVRRVDEVDDGKLIIIGRDLSELEEGGSYPFAVLIEVAGRDVEREAEGVLERRIHEFWNYNEGCMHLNQRYDIWLRISKRSVRKGLTSFKYIGTALYRLYKAAFPVIEKMQLTFITEPRVVEQLYEQALKVYEIRDSRILGLRDEEVDEFYGCKLCQSFAPTHVCVITPERSANCGAITWLDARVAVKIDPKGPIFPIPKGKLIDSVKGEYEYVNEALRKASGGAIQRVCLYTAFDNPHTSCGCFECVAFYIPEVDGLGIVHRGYAGPTPIGLKFGDIADAASGGKQLAGFHGLGIVYMRSRKFLQADGGWSRVAWITSELKQRVLDAIPLDLRDKIATENEASSIEELQKFLIERSHPLAQKIKAPTTLAPTPTLAEESLKPAEAEGGAEGVAEFTLPAVPATIGGLRVILKNVRIRAERIVLKRAEERK